MASQSSAWRVREPRAASLTEMALVAAVVTILVVRASLALAGWPQVGGSTLHIAHMLWGGLLMIVAFATLLQAADRLWKAPAALVFGIGLGLFLDEVGKFITQTNDYFFRPAVAVMYVVIIVFFLLTKLLDRLDRKHPEDSVYLATRAVSHLAMGPITETQRIEALHQIDHSGLDTPLTRGLRQLLETTTSIRADRTRTLWEVWDGIHRRWLALLAGRRVQAAVIWLYLLSVAVALLSSISAVTRRGATAWLSLSWQVPVVVLTVVGLVLWWRGNRLRAHQAFYAATWATLLFGQVYTFVRAQFLGIVWLLLDVIVLGVLRLSIQSARAEQPEEETAPVA